MKAIVFSDSHGSVTNMELAIDREKPDYIIFLGDGEDDFDYVRDFVAPGKIYLQVKGNCDYGDHLNNFVETICGTRIYLTHGNKEKVKGGLYELYAKATLENAKIALYGHTHCQDVSEINGIKMINPGSIRDGYYATIVFMEDTWKEEIKSITT